MSKMGSRNKSLWTELQGREQYDAAMLEENLLFGSPEDGDPKSCKNINLWAWMNLYITRVLGWEWRHKNSHYSCFVTRLFQHFNKEIRCQTISRVTRNGHVLEVKLQRGKVNAIDVPTSQALASGVLRIA